MHKVICKECGLEVLWYEKQCDGCGGSDFFRMKVYPSKVARQNDVEEYLIAVFENSTALAKSSQVCFCEEGHYMVYPGIRNGDNGEVQKLTTLPFCPRRVWAHGKIEIGINELLDKLKVEA
jgi:hypothetical protein